MKCDDFIRKLIADDVYAIDDEGNVFGKKRKDGTRKKLRIKPNSHGYTKFQASHNGETFYIAVHRLQYIKHKDSPLVDSMQIDHDDEDKTNNNIKNLVLATQSYNKSKSFYSYARLLEADAIEILKAHFERGESRVSITPRLPQSSRAIDMLINGQSHKHLAPYRVHKSNESSLTVS